VGWDVEGGWGEKRTYMGLSLGRRGCGAFVVEHWMDGWMRSRLIGRMDGYPAHGMDGVGARWQAG
jgi:hypothetical protein